MRFPFYIFPLASAIIWLAMLLAMFVTWKVDGSQLYPSEEAGQTIAYISDVGAGKLKPLFISMGAASVVIFDIGFLAERFLRHRGKLVHDTSMLTRIFAGGSIIFAIAGAAGLILLACFDTLRHPNLHDIFLAIFIGGYVFCAVCVCVEHQRLGVHFREFRVLRVSFWLKLTFIIVEVALAIAFGVLNREKRWNAAAIVEWIIALIYTFWVMSFIIDFLPAGSPQHHHMNGDTGPNMEEAAMANQGVANDRSATRYGRSVSPEAHAHYPSGTTASGGYTNGNSHMNGNGYGHKENPTYRV